MVAELVDRTAKGGPEASECLRHFMRISDRGLSDKACTVREFVRGTGCRVTKMPFLKIASRPIVISTIFLNSRISQMVGMGL